MFFIPLLISFTIVNNQYIVPNNQYIVPNNNVVYSVWFYRNRVIFRYILRPDETLRSSSSDGSKWTTDSENYIMRSQNGGDYARITSAVYY